MSTSYSSPSMPHADDLRSRQERCIDRLAELARSAFEPGPFFAEILDSAVKNGDAARARFWHQTANHSWNLSGELPPSSQPTEDLIERRQSLLNDVAAQDAPRTVSLAAEHRRLSTNGDGAKDIHIFIPIRFAENTEFVLETIHELDGTERPRTDSLQFLAMLGEITSDFLAQVELRQLRQLMTRWQKWDQFSQQMWQTLALDAVCAAIANDGRLLAECDRVSVLIRRRHGFRLQSVSGVERIESRSSAARNLNNVAVIAVRAGQSVWRDVLRTTEDRLVDAQQEEMLNGYLRDTAVTAIGIVLIRENDQPSAKGPISAVLIFERFKTHADLPNFRTQGELVAARAAPTLRAALQFDEIPWLTSWKRLHRLRGFALRPKTWLGLVILVGAASILTFVPAEFTVSGSAELWPAARREVFASSSSIVDEIRVMHGDTVTRGQPLIVLRDPVLETETPRIIGEIATINERLKGVQAARFTGATTPDAVSRTRQLTADEEELKERLKSLERQRSLIEERSDALILRSPIDGSVLTWNVVQHLSARPVERGQVLLTIGETSGAWIAEVQVADKDVGHLLRARQELNPALEVDLMLAEDPGRIFKGRVQEVSLTSESGDAPESHVRVIVAFDREVLRQPRAGASVLPRIRCGHKPLGYVWLHDLIDTIRTRVLF